jgi:plasmid stability protein
MRSYRRRNAGAESSSRSEKRRALRRKLDGTEIREPVAAAIDIADIRLASSHHLEIPLRGSLSEE